MTWAELSLIVPSEISYLCTRMIHLRCTRCPRGWTGPRSGPGCPSRWPGRPSSPWRRPRRRRRAWAPCRRSRTRPRCSWPPPAAWSAGPSSAPAPWCSAVATRPRSCWAPPEARPAAGPGSARTSSCSAGCRTRSSGCMALLARVISMTIWPPLREKVPEISSPLPLAAASHVCLGGM